MSYRVRRHARRTTSGKTTTVREHEREGGGSASPYVRDGDEIYEVHPDGSADRLPAPEWWGSSDERDEDWWAGDEPDAGDPDDLEATSDLPEDEPADDPGVHGTGLSPEMARLFGADTPEGAERYKRGHALRESGYAGWMDQDGYAVPDPHEPRGDQPSAALTRMLGGMREWRSRPEPAARPGKPMNPSLARALGCDTPEGLARYERGRAYREAGYDGPLDSDNRIPDPDDPENLESLSALAALGEI